MEATALLTLPLILFLSFTANGMSAKDDTSIVNQSPVIFDSDGDELRSGGTYYILPSLRNLPRSYSPAIVPGVFSKDTCWLQLGIEEYNYKITGVPVTLSPIKPTNDAYISETTTLHVNFSDGLSPLCGGSTVLNVGDFGDKFLSLGGAVEDGSSWFKIKRVSRWNDGVYKLVSSSGGDVGISTRFDGSRRLVLTRRNPLSFQFVAVKNIPSATK
ncbi:hypothetical protein TIFTF001_010216 [Ficus carica]|uniref:Uncharacterized protein n=1 Tax=Ficus carica TaxID=3494 RepID=A0AA87ZPR0_FICCA|nr:hypothetical protein TIFTF001_010216 [Ficus carica]